MVRGIRTVIASGRGWLDWKKYTEKILYFIWDGGCTQLSKLTTLYIQNLCPLLYVNYTLINIYF